MIDRILVAVDGSPFSLRAAQLGAKILHPNPAGVLCLLYVARPELDLTWFKGGGGDIKTAPEKEREALEQTLAKGREILRQTQETLQDITVSAPFRLEALVVVGDPAEKIIETAEKRQFEMIVLGSRGTGLIRGALLGSVSRKVVTGTNCPVLVVK